MELSRLTAEDQSMYYCARHHVKTISWECQKPWEWNLWKKRLKPGLENGLINWGNEQ
jgi:hypothetical protein